MTYNGWSNRATWSLAITIGNKQVLFNLLAELLTPLTLDEAVDFLNTFITDQITEELDDDDTENTTMIKDLVATALDQVDWRELVQFFKEDADAAANN